MKRIFFTSILMMSFFVSFSQNINWISIEEAEKLAKENPKKILIKIYTDWCGWCKRMDKDTFSQKEVADYVNEKFYAVKFNGEEKSDVKFKETIYKFKGEGKRGYNEFAAALTNGKLSYPSNSFIDENKQLLTTVSGYIKKDEFLKILQYFGDEAYKTQSWEQYNKNK